MIDFIIGVAVGSAFAPFWVALWNNYIKPLAAKILNKPKV